MKRGWAWVSSKNYKNHLHQPPTAAHVSVCMHVGMGTLLRVWRWLYNPLQFLRIDAVFADRSMVRASLSSTCPKFRYNAPASEGQQEEVFGKANCSYLPVNGCLVFRSQQCPPPNCLPDIGEEWLLSNIMALCSVRAGHRAS